MKKRYLTPILFLSCIPLLSSCATTQDVQTLNYHVRSINKKLEDMKVNTVDQMQRRQADSSGVLDQIQSEILELRAKLEENAHMNRMLQEQNKELQLSIQQLTSQQDEKFNATIAELNSKIAIQNESLTAIQQARVQEAERRSRAAAKAAEEAMRKAQAAKAARTNAAGNATGAVHIQPLNKKVVFTQKPTGPTPTTPTIQSSSSATAPTINNKVSQPTPELDSYSKGQQKYRDGDYKGAYSLFEKSASNKKDKDTSIRSRYMMGECLFKQKEYDQAIIQYQQIISNYPGDPQAAKALLRQGESFEQLSDRETAKIIYKKLTRAYSTSPEAATAKERLSALQ